MPQTRWTTSRRLLVSLPIFIIMIGILTTVSHLTAVPWKNEPTNQTIASLSANTAVTFDNPGRRPLPARGTFTIAQRYEWMNAVQPSTGAVQRIHMLVREPVGASGDRPAVVFMHGAGYGTADNSFGDVAHDLTSAGFVTAVIDKPVWHTGDLTRDYPASVKAYGQVVSYLRSLPNVDPGKVGLYATSESTWISAHLLQEDRRIAFQILLSPMVYAPRQAMGFLAAQDVAVVGAHPGYQSIVRRAFSVDFEPLGLSNADFDAAPSRSYAVPTFVAYGSKDVMTAQVQGAQRILQLAHASGNWNVTFRTYPVANHVLRLGDEALTGTPLADHYVTDMVSWAVGQVAGLHQSSQPVAGSTIYQSVAVPSDLRARPTLTWYMVLLHTAALLALVTTGVAWTAALVVRIRHAMIRRRDPTLGYRHGFGGVLLTMALSTMAAVLLFAAGLAQVLIGVTKLAWGAAPEPAGVIYWSWPVVQVVCTAVVWTWSRVFARMLEVASLRGVAWTSPARLLARRRGHEGREGREGSDGGPQGASAVHQPVVSSTRFGLTLFVITGASMFLVLLVFAFWGLFIY